VLKIIHLRIKFDKNLYFVYNKIAVQKGSKENRCDMEFKENK